jgi:hypothetical protein
MQMDTDSWAKERQGIATRGGKVKGEIGKEYRRVLNDYF